MEPRIRKLDSEFTFVFEGPKRKGASNIDHIGLDYRQLHRVESLEISDDIWEACNTSHRSVVVTLVSDKRRARREGEEEKKVGMAKRERREIPLNKIANVRVWEEYKRLCDEDGIMDAEAAGIWRSDGVEDGWHLLKDSLKRLEGVARDVYSGIGKAQKVRIGRRVTYDKNLRLLKKETTAAKRNLDK